MTANLTVCGEGESVAAHAAALIEARLTQDPRLVLGLATGRTPRPIYRHLVEARREGRIRFREAVSFNIDEYAGLAASDPASFRAYMEAALFAHVDLPAGSRHVPDGAATDLTAEAERYERAIAAAGGVGLQLLGLGVNGHIGFNEPGSAHDSRTRLVRLAESTRQANARDFPPGRDVPTHALTMGIATLIGAREIVLAVVGAHKAVALKAALEGPVTDVVPASALQGHERLHVVCDEASARLLR